jgi:alpha-D-ribose 1-methylphosphonate 5-triphosphate synthase subunit PhnL
VIDLIRDRRARGAAIVGIFHDVAVREALATRTHSVTPPRTTL